jgi:RNA polymerase sigma-70 factor (ECF subfamily)
MGNFLDESFMTGVVPGETSSVPSNSLSDDFMTGKQPPVSTPPKTSIPVLKPGETVLNMAPGQLQKEAAALANMAISVPGGVAGMIGDNLSRLSSLMYGTDAKEAGATARGVSDQLNSDWGKLTSKLGLHFNSNGSAIDAVMNYGMQASDTAGAAIDKATGGAIPADLVQTARDDVLNMLGVKGLKTGAIKAWDKTKAVGTEFSHALDGADPDITAAKAAVADSKARIAADADHAQAVQDVAAGTAAPATVDAVVAKAMEARHPLDVAWNPKAKPAAAKGSSPAWDNLVRGLVEEPGAKADATLSESAITEVPQAAPEGPGLTQKTTLAEPTIIGEAPDLVESGLDKLRQGQLISTPEAEAIRALKPLPGQGTIVDPEGKPYFQRGQADPALLKTLGLMGLGAVAGTALYNWYQSSSGLSEDNARDVGAGLAGLGAVGMLKGKLEGVPEPRLIDLVKQAGAEGEGAAAKLYTDTKSQLTRTVQSWDRGGKEGLPVEDIVQNTYMKAFEAIKKGQFRGDSSLSTFLHKIAQNEKFNVFNSVAEKTARRSSSLEVDPETGGAIVPEKYTMEQSPEKYQSAQDQAATNQLAQRMQSALDKLPEDQAAVFKALEMDGLSYEEAAAQLDVPIGTIRSRFSRAKENLQGSLRDYKDLQAGNVDPKVLAKIAATVGGAVYGYNKDKSPLGLLLGAAVGMGGAALADGGWRSVASALSDGLKADERIRITPELRTMNTVIETANRDLYSLGKKVEALGLPRASLSRITHSLEGDTSIKLTPEEVTASNTITQFFSKYGQLGLKSGVLHDLLNNYVTHVYGSAGKSLLESIMQERTGGSTSSPFAKTRTGPPTIAEINSHAASKGLQPITDNILEIVSAYGKSLAGAMAHKGLLESLKGRESGVLGPKGLPDTLLMKISKAPADYERINHPSLQGYLVHPDIAPNMRFVLSTAELPAILKGVVAVNQLAKRAKFTMSLFHDTSLMMAMNGAEKFLRSDNLKNVGIAALGAGVGALVDPAHPLRGAAIGATAGFNIRRMGPALRGTHTLLDELAKNDPSDEIGKYLHGGLKLAMGGLGTEDLNMAGFKAFAPMLDSQIPGTGKLITATAALSDAFTRITFEQVQTVGKLSIAMGSHSEMLMSEAKALARDPNFKITPSEELYRKSSDFANTIQGGLNWQELAEGMKTKAGRDFALAALSPKGRAVLQLLEIAPDWALSTARAGYMSAGTLVGGEAGSLRGLIEPKTTTDLYRRYMLRSMVIQATVANAINYSMSGHPIWENRDKDGKFDPTFIDYGNGQHQQWNKHYNEFFHWGTKTKAQFLAKLSYAVSEPLNQLFGTEYLAPRITAQGQVTAGPVMKGSPILHALKGFQPMSVDTSKDLGSNVAGFLGAPILGTSTAEIQAARESLKQLHQTPEYKALQAERRAAKRRSAQ